MATSEIRKKAIFLTACLYYSREPDSQPENTLSLVGITVLETHFYKVTCNCSGIAASLVHIYITEMITRQLDKRWGVIYTFVLTVHKNNRFQKKTFVQNRNMGSQL